MNLSEEEITDLIEVCKYEFKSASEKYKVYQPIGNVVSDRELDNMLRRKNQIISQFSSHREIIDDWFCSLAHFRGEGILSNESEFMQVVESLKKLL